MNAHSASFPGDENLLLQNEQLSHELQRRIEQLAAINTVATAVSQTLDLETALETALNAVLKVIPVQATGISLVDEQADELVLRAQLGWKFDFVSQPMRIPLGMGMSGMVVRNDEVMITGDVSDDPRLHVPEFAQEKVQAMALVPMHARGRVVGILSVMNYAPYEFDASEIDMLRAIADQVGIALDNARQYENAREQSSRLGAVLHSSGDAIIATDSYGSINLVNATAEALFDISASELIGMRLRSAPLPTKIREGLRRAMDLGGGGNTVFEATLEDGRFLAAIVSPVYASQGLENDHHAEGWVMVVRDMTFLREAEQSRINFIRAAAHDLRNPLATTINALRMLHNDLGGLSEMHEEIIDLAQQSINRMQDLIDDLLNLERIESGVGVKAEPVDVRDLVERGIVDTGTGFVEHSQRLNVDVPDYLPYILGDMHWLHRALVNLLSNANKYTPSGGDITIRAYVREDDVYLEVQDNGPGVSPEAQARLFERFYRAPATSRDVKGTGLGLSIVKSVAEQHGGRVFVQSSVGQGSTFGMIIPLPPDDEIERRIKSAGS